MDDRMALEQMLLKQPFDRETRRRYAQLLLDETDCADALTQFDLLVQQDPRDPSAWVGAARSLLALGRTTDALSRYEEAKRLPGFETDAALERIAAKTHRPTPIASVSALPNANVVSIQQVAPERVRFSSIVGMGDLKKTLRLKIIEPFLNPGLFKRFRKQAGGGVLLYGPPGCGKTMIARALANECDAAFVAVGVADVLSMWIGGSEQNLAGIFDKARSETPSILFFDELDALAFSRSKAHSEHTRTTVNEFLIQMDSLHRDGVNVLVIAATNMPWDVDPAMKRPGRFSRQIFVAPPDAETRLQMLQTKLMGIPHDPIDLRSIAVRTANFSGADLDGMIDLATEFALEDSVARRAERPIRTDDFDRALETVQASTAEWLQTARNLVRYAGADRSYRDVERYLKQHKLL